MYRELIFVGCPRGPRQVTVPGMRTPRTPPGHAALTCAAVTVPLVAAWPDCSCRRSRCCSPAACPRPAAAGAAWLLWSGQPVGMWITGSVLVLFVVPLPWMVGRYLRSAGALEKAGWERARILEREAAMAAERARLPERSRIAGEPHDAVGRELGPPSLRAGALETGGRPARPPPGPGHRAVRGRAPQTQVHSGHGGHRGPASTGPLHEDRLQGGPPTVHRVHGRLPVAVYGKAHAGNGRDRADSADPRGATPTIVGADAGSGRTKSPGPLVRRAPGRCAEDRGFEPRKALPPNRISSAAP